MAAAQSTDVLPIWATSTEDVAGTQPETVQLTAILDLAAEIRWGQFASLKEAPSRVWELGFRALGVLHCLVLAAGLGSEKGK